MDPNEGTAAPAAPKPKKVKKKSPKRKAKKRVIGPKKGQYRVIKPKRPAKKSKTVVRSERLDMRLSKAEKAKVVAKAKKTRRTVTSLIIEAIERIR